MEICKLENELKYVEINGCTLSVEEKMRIEARRSIVALNDIMEGEIFSEKNIGLRRPGNGLKPIMLKKILGQISKQKIVKGRLIELGDFENGS